MALIQKTFLISTLIIIINGIYGNIYSIAKYIFFINLGYFIFKYIIPKCLTQKIKEKEEENEYIIGELKNSGENNSIFLTQFKYSGIILYLYHFAYGYYNYFFDFINLFCLMISFIQIYDYLDFRSFIPLSIFSTLYSLYYLYTVSKLIKEQNIINNKYFVNKKISNIKKGDIIEMDYKNIIPADILILSDDLHVTVNELQLNGENIMINKRSLFDSVDLVEITNSTIKIGQDNKGYIIYKNKCYNYDENNIIFRDTKMIDGNLRGIVIGVGNKCMIYNIDNQIVKEKTWLYKKVNSITFDNLYYLLILASILSGALKYVYPEHKFIILMKTIILLLNTIVPLSLQSFYNASTWILSRKIQRENNIIINSHGTHVFQNNPKYIVSDKTGTITKNKLRLVQVINAQNDKLVNIIDPTIENVEDILSCTLINIHSNTDELLNNDEMEYLLLKWSMKNIKLLNNNYNDGNRDISYCKYINEINNEEKIINKLLYKPFDYTLGIKYCFTKNNGSYYLNVQGTPESINDYTKNNLIHKAEKQIGKMSDNCYRRVICYGKKRVTEEILNNIYNTLEIKDILNEFEYVNMYVFEDEIVENLKDSFKQILNKNRCITILTGDRLSSSIEVSKILDIYHNPYHIENIDSMNNINIIDHETILINGKILNELEMIKSSIMPEIIKKKNKIIVYRATPETKEKYIEYIKTIDPENQVMMIGDGSNDIAAIMKSDVGISIIGESNQVQNISDLILDRWTKIPEILENFAEKKDSIEHIIKWVLSKHILTATILLSMMLITNFEQLRDPTNPYEMIIFNSLLFVSMCLFCINNNIRIFNNTINKGSYTKNIYKSFKTGILIGLCVFSILDPNRGIRIALITKFIYLICKI